MKYKAIVTWTSHAEIEVEANSVKEATEKILSDSIPGPEKEFAQTNYAIDSISE